MQKMKIKKISYLFNKILVIIIVIIHIINNWMIINFLHCFTIVEKNSSSKYNKAFILL